MITQEQIDSWIKEAEDRPASAALIIQFIANRLRDLTSRNEELLNENISLLSGKRVEEYEKRISHLEYQLELLKRLSSGEAINDVVYEAATQPTSPSAAQPVSLLLYSPTGEVIRLAVEKTDLENVHALARFPSLPSGVDELRLLAVQESDELMFIFTSGRIETLPASEIPLAQAFNLAWSNASMPGEPYGGELLAGIAPISNLAFTDFILQVSRKGCMKKMSASLAQSILDKRFIGTGVKSKTDRTFELLLSRKEDRLTLVSNEGFLASVEVKRMPFNIEEALRLGTSDHLVSAFTLPSKGEILFMTRLGKAVHLEAESLETTSSAKSRGQSIISQKRRESGVRVVGAGVFSADDWAAALHRDGIITLHAAQALFDQGSLPTSSELLAFIPMPAVVRR